MLLRWCWYLVLAAVLYSAELLLAQGGVLLAASFCLAFYLTVARQWRTALAVSALLAISVEVRLGREVTVLPLLPLVTWAGTWWPRYGTRHGLLPQALPGAVLGALYGGYVALLEAPHGSGAAWRHATAQGFSLGLGGLLAGAVLLPLFIALADGVAGSFNLPRYAPHRLPTSTAPDGD